jgi:isopentenyl phosphate kinase
MAASKLRLVVVHGGGSFGHPVAREYGLSSRRTGGSAEGVTRTRDAMLRLNQLVCSSMSEAGLHPYPFAPFDMLMREGARRLHRSSAAQLWIESLLEAGMTPVAFGDVVIMGGEGFRILSGDTIAYQLCSLLSPDRCVFAVDVDGVYDVRGNVIPVVEADSVVRGTPVHGRPAEDVTGGIQLKLKEAARIAALGVPTVIVSGNKPHEFAKTLRGLSFHGSRVKGPS